MNLKEYEEEWQGVYKNFAENVSSILKEAIDVYKGSCRHSCKKHT
jgi:hypothetical protein